MSLKMLSSLNNVVAIMDMDGFVINNSFHCKELGVIKFGDAAAQSWFFDIGFRRSDLSAKDQRTVRYVQDHVHRLPFGIPSGVKAYPISALGDIIAGLFKGMCKTENSVFAYKGGHYEKDLLASLSIPSLNLENFGCPKAERLLGELVWLETCGNHIIPDAYAHCPKVEVEAYAHWMENYFSVNNKVNY